MTVSLQPGESIKTNAVSIKYRRLTDIDFGDLYTSTSLIDVLSLLLKTEVVISADQKCRKYEKKQVICVVNWGELSSGKLICNWSLL